MQATAPRQYGPSLNVFAAPDRAVLPGDQLAHAAARRLFTDLQRTFVHVLDGLPGTEWLRRQVWAAEEPVDLWLLRAPAFAALSGGDPQMRLRRQHLRRGLDSVFPDLDEPSGFTPF